MHINQLKYFLAIVKTGSFSNAADDMFISQSSMSKQIKALEAELHVSLFKREHSKVYLTEAGGVFHVYAQTALKEYDKMLLAMEQFQTVQQNTIRMGSIPIVSSYGVARRIAEFTNLHKDENICFNMRETDQFFVVKELNEGVVDMALMRIDPAANMEEYDMIPYVLDEFVLVCHEKHALAHAKSVALEEISWWPFLVLDQHSMLYTIVVEAFARRQLQLKIHCSTTRHKILMEMVSAGMGVTIMPLNLVDTLLFPKLCTVELQEPIRSFVSLVKRKEQKLNRISLEFWKYWRKKWSLDM